MSLVDALQARSHQSTIRFLSDFGFRSTLDPVALRKLTRSLREWSPDLLHTHLWAPGIAGRAAATWLGIPVVSTWHAPPVHWNRLGPIRTRARFLAERLTLRGVALTATSQATAKAWQSRIGDAPSRVSVIPNGIQLPASTPPLGQKPVVVHVGNLVPARDHFTLIEAAAIVHRRRPDVRWICAGDGPLRSQLESFVRRRGLEGVVEFVGLCSDVFSLLARARVSVLTSRSEGCPLALLEAMAVARPVVATGAPGVTEIIESGVNGVLATVGDPREVARAVEFLLRDEEQARRLGEAGQQTVRNRFALEIVTDRYEALYRETLKERRNSGR